MSVFREFRRTLHWGPFIALGIIKVVSFVTIQCAPAWWPTTQSVAAMFNIGIFVFSSSMTLFHFFASLSLGPGYAPVGWSPVRRNDTAFLQYCKVCCGYKPPRSHHCTKCGRCVLKMDHHCPWINNCVGHANHGHFTAFLTFAVIGCAHASVILTGYLLSIMNRPWYPRPLAYVGPWRIFWIVLSLGLAIGVVIAVGILLFFQIKAILKNRTGIEDWILEKANARRSISGEVFLYPYDIGKKGNWSQVLTFWCKPAGDGITWPVRNGCNQYTLTVEQLTQKSLKRDRSIDYEVVRNYSGSWFPLLHGVKTALCQPCSDEPRIPLEIGDTITVTRWKKYWYYGEVSRKLSREKIHSRNRIRGWFPKKCVKVLDPAPVTAPGNEEDKKVK